MITRRTHIRQTLRHARAAALTSDERRAELRAAEARIETRRHGDAPAAASPRTPDPARRNARTS